jgi:hypothetical protein
MNGETGKMMFSEKRTDELCSAGWSQIHNGFAYSSQPYLRASVSIDMAKAFRVASFVTFFSSSINATISSVVAITRR